MEISQNYRYLIGGSHNKDYNVLGSILGSAYCGKTPYKGFEKIVSIPCQTSTVCLFLCATSKKLLTDKICMSLACILF